MTQPIISTADPLWMPSAKLETAFVELIELSRGLTNPPIADAVSPFVGNSDGKIRFPAIVVEVVRCVEESPKSGIWNFEMMIHCVVKFLLRADSAKEDSRAMAGAVQEILQAHDRTLCVLNKPAEPDPDERPVREFHLCGYAVTDETLSREGRRAITTIGVQGTMVNWDCAPQGGRFAG